MDGAHGRGGGVVGGGRVERGGARLGANGAVFHVEGLLPRRTEGGGLGGEDAAGGRQQGSQPARPRPHGCTCCRVGTSHTRAVVSRVPMAPTTSGSRVVSAAIRSEERRVGKEWVSPFRSRWSPYH